MYSEIENILKSVNGDIIDFRTYKGATFSQLVKLGGNFNRTVVGMDTFYGLEMPEKDDWNDQNQLNYPKGYARATPEELENNIAALNPNNTTRYEIYSGKLIDTLKLLPERKYALALIDLLQYSPTKAAIEYAYSRMAENGVMYFLNYSAGSTTQSSKAINDFLESYGTELTKFPPISYNDNILNICRVAVHSNTTPAKKKKNPFLNSIKSKFTKTIGRVTTNEKIIIALVLRTGGDTYNAKYVNALAENIKKHTTINYKLVVMTDNPTGFDKTFVDETISLKHNYKGWWSKIELFRPGIFDADRVFYMDLDTVVVGNIDELLLFDTNFAGIRDLYHLNFLQTGLLSWNPAYSHQIYENFISHSIRIMNEYPEGDARWIRENLYNYDYLQDEFPNKIVSYKAHCLNKNTGAVTIPKDAAIVCFHGKPRPHTVTSPLITEHWSYK